MILYKIQMIIMIIIITCREETKDLLQTIFVEIVRIYVCLLHVYIYLGARFESFSTAPSFFSFYLTLDNLVKEISKNNLVCEKAPAPVIRVLVVSMTSW